MAGLADHGENLALNWMFTAQAVTRPTAWYVGLHTSAPSDATPSNGELVGNNYARQAVTFGAASSGQVANTGSFQHGPATGSNWGTITHVSIWDAPSGGNCLAFGSVGSPVAINVNDSVTGAIGALTVTYTD